MVVAWCREPLMHVSVSLPAQWLHATPWLCCLKLGMCCHISHSYLLQFALVCIRHRISIVLYCLFSRNVALTSSPLVIVLVPNMLSFQWCCHGALYDHCTMLINHHVPTVYDAMWPPPPISEVYLENLLNTLCERATRHLAHVLNFSQ